MYSTEAEFLEEIILAIHSHLYSFSLRFLFIKTLATSYIFLQAHATFYITYFYSLVTAH
jgi:hypothetical protein